MQSESFDIIIAGSGLAGLSLAYRAIKEGVWQKERILIIDKDAKGKNDRTWCFWQMEKEEFAFRDVIYHSWKELSFYTNEGTHIRLDNGDYAYHMIRSIDFYQFVLSFLHSCKQVTFIQDNILSLKSTADGGIVETGKAHYKAKYLFNSTYVKPELHPSDQYFLQHFKGVTILTDQFKGNPAEMHLMDYRTSQEQGTTFFYVLPITQNRIFIEYTIFSKNLLEKAAYDRKIVEYITTVLKIADYEIIESEFGVIPMTDYRFKRRSENIMHIGTVGGDTRASSGYTFTNIQKTVSKILASYRKNGHPFAIRENINEKHHVLDGTILKVLDNRIYQGHEIFSDLFAHVEGKIVFAFLDSESNILDDLKIMRSLKADHFIKPFVQTILKRF